MKKEVKITKSAVATLFALCAMFFTTTSCERNPNMIEIPFAVYSNEGLGSMEGSGLYLIWKGLKYDNKVIIINSREEMEKYTDSDISDYPEVDFSNNTLLLASGCTSSGIEKVTVNHLQKLSPNEYLLDIEVLLWSACVEDYWAAVLIVEKMSEESAIDLKICHIDDPYKMCEIIKMY